MTIFVVPLQHRFAGTSPPRRRTHFIPAPPSTGTASPTSPQSGRRVRQQRPIRNHQRLSALSHLGKTVPPTKPLPHQIPIDGQALTAFPRVRSSEAFGRRPHTGSTARAGPPSETLHDSGHRSRKPVSPAPPFGGAWSQASALLADLGRALACLPLLSPVPGCAQPFPEPPGVSSLRQPGPSIRSRLVFLRCRPFLWTPSYKKPIGGDQVGKFGPAEIDRAPAEHRASAFWNDDLRILAQIMHDLFGADQRPDAFRIGHVSTPRSRTHVELPAMGSGVLRFRPGEHAVIADCFR